MSGGLKKMPEPITDPTVIITAEIGPSDRRSSCSAMDWGGQGERSGR